MKNASNSIRSKLFKFAFIANLFIAIVAVAGCSSDTVNFVENPDLARQIAGGEPLNLSHAGIKSLLSSRISELDSIVSGNLVGSYQGKGFDATSRCGQVLANSCRFYFQSNSNLPTFLRGATYDLVLTEQSTNTLQYSPLFSLNFVALVQGQIRLDNWPSSRHTGDIIAIGGILDNGAFVIEGIRIFEERLFRRDQLLTWGAAAYSFGDRSNSAPAISGTSATWSGAMVGVDLGSTPNDLSRLNTLSGIATLTVRNAENRSTVDVSFSGIRSLNQGFTPPRSIQGWAGIPLSSDTFRSGSGNDQIEGTFYGTNHKDVGGHFERGTVIGAFGAKRQGQSN